MAGRTEDACVVDQDMNGPERLDSRLDDLVAFRDGTGSCDSLSAS